MSLPLLLLLLSLFIYLFFCVTLGALFCIDGLLATWHTLWPRVRLRLAGKPRFQWKSFQFSRIFQGKGPFDIYLSFLLFLPLVTFLLSFCMWCLQSSYAAHFALCLLSFLLILRYAPYLRFFFLSDFLSFEFFFSLFLCIFL